jgi:hypothetical protein
MSSFQLHLSSLTLGAKERLARLDAAGGIKSLLSPSSSGVPAPTGSPGTGVLGVSAMTAAPLPEHSRLSVESLVASGGGGVGSGEFSGAGGFSGGLSVFVATPELIEDMCLGAVAGGVKFCTLRKADCSFTTHSRKVEVARGVVYLSAGSNSAFTHHYAPTEALTEVQVEELLGESHTKEEWIRLLRGLTEAAADSKTLGSTPNKRATSVVDAVTPARKRKIRYEEDLRTGTLFATPVKPNGGQ